MDLNGYDASQYEPTVGGGGSPVPPGDYLAVIVATEEKENSKGTGSYLNITFEIVEGECQGRKVYTLLNLNNTSKVAVEIAQKELSAICHAVNVLRPRDSNELHNIPLVLSVILQDRNDKPGEKTNKIVGYAPRGGAAPQRQQAFGQQPPQQQQQYAQQPAAATAPAVAPWKR